MAQIDEKQIEEIVSQVLKTLQQGGSTTVQPTLSASASTSSRAGVFATVAEAIAAAKTAQAAFVKLGFAKRREIIEAIKTVSLANAERLADLAVQDTNMGNVAHKVMKNEGAVTLSPGVEDLLSEAISGDSGTLLIEYVPFGVINSITPTTNPTSTVINHAIIMLSAGNAVVFSPHPNARDCTEETMHVINEAIVKAGAPPNLLTSVANASLRTAKEIMEHPDIAMLVATGGASVVKAALSSGKKTIAAGPGNPPAIIDETADVQEAAKHVIAGTSFDNNLLCIGEKALFVIESVANETVQELTQNNGHLLNASQLQDLEAVVSENGESNKEYIGKDATTILNAAGITAPAGTVAIVVEVPADHNFVINEYLMPILPVVRCRDFDEALAGAVRAEGGRGHTAVLHTNNTQRITQFNKVMDCSVVVINAPSYASCGLEGEGFLAMTIAGPTGEGYTRPRTFTRQRRLTVANNLSAHTQ
ncbi:aldehyde dehydrogenase family protein [Candidatus Poribacteria bacterium]|nr:aldehyde dehydrogenase [Candidatus Poribacteria bacterium]MYA71253.1 aldehyde dehydrogenase family protein [Candidatus Poribacteria bacterium]MYH83632.1 aldehyde dehydrogenase family protein [Candidatus Poribacteria bacterium]MYK92865.1 aldehyde dehydrogenase family protein [Candidatus Poribacteria bacterium]